MSSEGQKRLPPPASPAERTAGQVVAEAMRLYGRRFRSTLLVGVPPTLAGIALAAVTGSGVTRTAWLILAVLLGAPALGVSYVAASVLAIGRRPPRRTLLIAFALGVLVLVPIPFLATILIFPAVAWFALVGLSVPAAVAEELELGPALRRAIDLARADFVHALGSLAAAVIIAFVSAGVLQYLLIQFGDAAGSVAAFIAILLLTPLVFLASSVLYFDQVARIGPVRKGLTAPRGRGQPTK